MSHESFKFPSLLVGVIATEAARCIRTSSTRVFMRRTWAFSLSAEGPGRLPDRNKGSWYPCFNLVLLLCCPCHFGLVLSVFVILVVFGPLLYEAYAGGTFLVQSCCLSSSRFSCSCVIFRVILLVYFLSDWSILPCYFCLEVSCFANVLYPLMFLLMLFLFWDHARVILVSENSVQVTPCL